MGLSQGSRHLSSNLSQWTKGLNKEQIRAVESTEGPLLILAGAGSGKTTVLVSRTGHIISSGLAAPSEILVLTFTNKAAKELGERVSQKLSHLRLSGKGKSKEKIWTGTFHGFGLEFLKKNYKAADLPKKFGLIDSADSRFIIKDLLKNKTHSTGNAGFDLETLQRLLSDMRSGKKISPDTPEAYSDMAEWILPDYISRMHSLGVVDFDGLLLKPIEMLKADSYLREKYREQYKYLMVDEFQDTNKIQMDLVMTLMGDKQNLAVVGDDDQSIYGWRGAEIKNILNFPKLFKKCEVVRLETNYRSTPEIIKMANSIIERNEDRHTKKLIPRQGVKTGSLPEVFIYKDEDTECEEVVSLIRHYNRQNNLDDIAVLFRSNSQGTLLEGALRLNRIPYEMTGGPALIDRKEVRDVLSYIKSALFPNDISLRRILNVPHRGIGDTSVHKIIDHQKESGDSFIKALRSWEAAGVNSKSGASITEFFDLLYEIRVKILKATEKYEVLLPKIFKEIKYRDLVLGSYKDGATAMRKWQLVEILGRILDGFVKNADGGDRESAIKDFVDALSLREPELSKEKKEKKVQLLTFHASKGLEFPVVILMGVDEGLIPHETLGHDTSEERRLFYVGVTRAMNELVLTRAAVRKRYGTTRQTAPSRFLAALPGDLYNLYESGIKPISENQRVDMLADLYKSLDMKSKAHASKDSE
jgi:DNA helicase-2/ATP-dependent DNA helicase PcrA